MKISKQAFSAFISHNGLTVFANKTPSGFTIKTTERMENGQWRTAGEMKVTREEFAEWLKLLGELKQ